MLAVVLLKDLHTRTDETCDGPWWKSRGGGACKGIAASINLLPRASGAAGARVRSSDADSWSRGC